MAKITLSKVVAFNVLLYMATSSFAASNLNLSKSNVNRILPSEAVLVSATADVSINETRIIYTTPETGDLVLTSICGSDVRGGGMRVAAEGFGRIAETAGNTVCHAFNPGVIMPHNSAITCSTTFAIPLNRATSHNSYFCTISGYFIGEVTIQSP